MIEAIFFVNSHGVLRLARYYSTSIPVNARSRVSKALATAVSTRPSGACNVLLTTIPGIPRDSIIVYQRFASLYCVMVANKEEPMLELMSMMRTAVEALDAAMPGVSEVDLALHPSKAFMALDCAISSGVPVALDKSAVQKTWRLKSKI